MASFPPDRFDGVHDDIERVGAHRTGTPQHRGLVAFAWAALATGVLVGAGVLFLDINNNSFQFHDPSTASAAAGATTGAATTPAVTATPTTTPVTDPTTLDFAVTKIAVLNGTTTSGLAAKATLALTDYGWKVATEGNATGSPATSTVYYSAAAPANHAIALGVAQRLGITTVAESASFPNASVTVVLGTDYAG